MKIGKYAAGLLAAAPLLASAQSSVTLYGVVDTGVEFVNNVGAAGNSVARMNTLTGTVPSAGACAAPRISAAA